MSRILTATLVLILTTILFLSACEEPPPRSASPKRAQDQALIMVIERVQALAQTYEAREYVALLFPPLSSESEYDEELKAWKITITAFPPEAREGFERAEWFDGDVDEHLSSLKEPTWVVYDYGRIVPMGGAFMIEADIEQLNIDKTLPASPPTPQPAPTPPPTPTPRPQILNRVKTLKVSDVSGDTFDKNGRASKGAPYLDIFETEMTLWSDNRYTAKITVNGDIPARTDEPSNFIEWDVLIDSDNNPSTGQISSLLFNDIGVDYIIRFFLNGDKHGCSIVDVKTDESVSFPCPVHPNMREFTIFPKQIGEPAQFSFTIAVREYGVAGDPTSLITADKAPNQGHYSFPDGSY